jgi:hypothetical protein
MPIYNFKEIMQQTICECGNEFDTRKIVCDRNYYFNFSLSDQLRILLDNFKVDESFNSGELFNHFKQRKGKIISLLIFIDGVPLFHGSCQIWNLFIQVVNLKASILARTFLNSAYTTKYGHPNPHFF